MQFPFLQDYRFHVQRNWRYLLNRTHERDFDVLAKLPGSSKNLFLDIGSNRGEAVQSILMRRPDARVIGFEPNPCVIRKAEGIYKTDRRVRFYNFGLGSETGAYDLYIPFYNNYMFDGLASFKEENARTWLRTRVYGYQENRLRIVKVTCHIKRLDDLNLRPSFVKIDVQGFEYEVLLGADRTIRECNPVLLIETPGEKEIQFLEERGYDAFVYDGSRLVPGKKNLNVFFIRKK